MEGNYHIEAGATETRVCRVVGYSWQEVAMSSRAMINVVLEGEGTELEEVVVIGYGTAQKRDLTGSIRAVKGEDIVGRPGTNPVANLQGKVAGLQVTN